MRSLKLRLVLLTMLGTTTVLAITGWIVYSQHRSQLFDIFDESLKATANNMNNRIAEEGHILGLIELSEVHDDTTEAGHLSPIIQLVGKEGETLFELKDDNTLHATPQILKLHHREIIEYEDSQGTFIRSYALPVELTLEEQANMATVDIIAPSEILVVSASADHVHFQSKSLATLIFQISAIATVIAGGFTWLAVSYGLRPLGALAHAIGETTPETLNAKISTRNQPTEVRPVVDRLNDLLGRLDEAIVRERTMSTNVAHELRTPVAALISTLEVRLREDVNSEDKLVLTECLSVAQGMSSVVSSLLTLSRLESKQVALNPTDTPVVELISEIWKTEQVDGVDLLIESEQEVVINSDRELLRLAFSNALSNAAQFAPKGTSITVSADIVDDLKIVTFMNHGCDLEPEDADKVFDRFWRQDSARSEANLHCGLGATLIKEAGEAAGAIVTATVVKDQFILMFEFPFELK